MSYILDALKRSEQERHQEQVADLSNDMMILPTQQKKTHLWPYLLIAVLAFNALAYVYFNISEKNIDISNKSVKQPDPVAPSGLETPVVDNPYPGRYAPLDTAPQHTVPSTREMRRIPQHVMQARTLTKRLDIDHFEGLRGANKNTSYSVDREAYRQSNESNNDSGFKENDSSYQEEGILIRPKSYQKGQNSVLPVTNEIIRPALIKPQVESIDSPVFETSIDSTAPLSPSSTTASSESIEAFQGIPHLSELSVSFQRSIPDLTFNSHIYSQNVTSRRVMINSIYLKEGQGFLGMGLIEIGEFYILLNKENKQFKLPVLRDWMAP